MDKKGQALVETALIFPVFIWVILVYFSLLALYHDALVLQTAAAQWARQSALEPRTLSPVSQSLLTSTRLTGRVQPPRFSQQSIQMSPTRIFKGIEVVRGGGSITTAQVQSRMFSRHFSQWTLPSVPLNYSAEFPADPPIPGAE